MLVHHQSYWRKAQISELPPIGECYEATQNRLQGAFNKHDAVQVSLKADLFLSLPTEAPAQDPAVEENTAEEILALKKSTAKEILGLTDEHCTPKEFEPSLQWDQRVHAYAICTEWLATHLFESGASQDGEEGYGYLNRAIESLKQGDYECRIWAAALSRRLKLWLELEKRYKKAPRLTKDNRKSTFERKPSNAKGGGDQRGLLLDPDEGNEHKKSRSKKFENEIARLHAIKLMIPESPIERVGSYHLKGSRAHQRLKRKGEEAGLLPALERFIMTMLFVPGQRDL
ncbi:hypothetical protein QQS21_010296 [Conoideocrella luteorostrata]|uniref:Uncharacterized protein n=1 Tax=Conoideocrella luteorostrata TaxID=1105319 RepID=A0AAJ0CFC5_9HYPO|nr:hypothetical protein QQS21_010296 [Conoideocrella luteorostrata]